ncbi:hypothetical protein MSAR_23280 [Mycolicibacterium sarraceniae]|uniref:Uncharacterized protein n=1 Tax=Mycolicibacterium sarraceniae TaxID=1534348 RepID=A0A7I7SQC7_9MYCO|nr:hypothetical protein MSAR_23280 [Mycolicibacterium sarraceniae]
MHTVQVVEAALDTRRAGRAAHAAQLEVGRGHTPIIPLGGIKSGPTGSPQHHPEFLLGRLRILGFRRISSGDEARHTGQTSMDRQQAATAPNSPA